MASSGGLHGGTTPLAALTTIFTPPCPTSWEITTTKVPSQYPPFPTEGPAECDPPLWSENMADQGFQYYSPAICPDGFGVGPSCSIAGKTRTAEGFPNVESGETVAWCVPSGYTCTSDTTDFRGGIWGVLRTAAESGATVTVAPAMQIRWRDVDLTALETHPLSPGVVVGQGTVDETPSTSATDRGVRTISIVGGGIMSTISNGSPTDATTLPPSVEVASTAKAPSRTSSEPQPSETDLGGTSPAPSVSSSIQPGGIDSSSNSTTSAATSRDTNLPMVATILTSLLLAVVAGAMAFLFIRRYRRKKAGQPGPLLSVGLGVWARRNLPWQRAGALPARESWRQGLDAEAGAAVVAGQPASELGPGLRLGCKENPAELEGKEVESQRWSWVSRMFSIRVGKDEPVTPTSTRRFTASSRWTLFTERGPRGLAMPPPPYTRPSSARSASTGWLGRLSRARSPLARWSRASDGTFGRPGSRGNSAADDP